MNGENDRGTVIILLIALFGAMIIGLGFGTLNFKIFIMGMLLLIMSIIFSLIFRISKLEANK